MKKLFVILLALLGIGCGGASISNVRKDLPPGALPRATMLFVAPADSSATVFKGDGSDEPQTVANARQTLGSSLAPQVINTLHSAGFQAYVPQGNVPPDAVVVSMVVRECSWGSNAARIMVGFGAGAAYLLTDVKIIQGNALIADFSVDANSGGRGGFSAAGDFMPSFMQQTAKLVVDYLSNHMK
jgi:Domain of unknown function (DUF4410)